MEGKISEKTFLLTAIALVCGFGISSCAADKNDGEDPVDLDELFLDVTVEEHPQVANILTVSWTQAYETNTVWLEYRFEGEEWLESPRKPGAAGEHEELVLGVPGQTDVTLRLCARKEEQQIESTPIAATTGSVPVEIPLPVVVTFDPALASPHRWMLVSIEDTGGPHSYYGGPFWVLIIDRLGRVVWYYQDEDPGSIMSFPRIARDGSHIAIEKRNFSDEGYRPRVHLMTLDFEYSVEIDVPDLCDCFDVTDRGTVLYNTIVRDEQGDISSSFLTELGLDGQARQIWDCKKWAEDQGAGPTPSRGWCYSNTVNWDPNSDTVMLSMPYRDVVVQVDRQTGELKGQWGSVQGSWDFDPPDLGFEFQHFPFIAANGNLLISTHSPEDTDTAIPGRHRFIELEIDDEAKVLRQRWIFGEGIDDWPKYKGMASHLENGNTLVNYGTGGVVREVTRTKQVAWHLFWDADFEETFLNKMVGNNILIDDLYPLCLGPQ